MERRKTVKDMHRFAGYKATPMRSPNGNAPLTMADKYKQMRKCGGN